MILGLCSCSSSAAAVERSSSDKVPAVVGLNEEVPLRHTTSFPSQPLGLLQVMCCFCLTKRPFSILFVFFASANNICDVSRFLRKSSQCFDLCHFCLGFLSPFHDRRTATDLTSSDLLILKQIQGKRLTCLW